jgi:glycerol-3-phosphate dehydrogenase
VRPLYDDGASSASAATRDYVLNLDESLGAPSLNVFGGKITTYRCLAESALEEIKKVLPVSAKTWTAGVALPGGDFAVDGVEALLAQVKQRFPFLAERTALRLVRGYGTEVSAVLGYAKTKGDLGQDFGAELFAAEVEWLIDKEFAQSADDVVWRRTKLGLRMDQEQIDALDQWIKDRLTAGNIAAAE